jgi:hypothetical protein
MGVSLVNAGAAAGAGSGAGAGAGADAAVLTGAGAGAAVVLSEAVVVVADFVAVVCANAAHGRINQTIAVGAIRVMRFT